MKVIPSTSGFTIVELVIAMAIFSVMSLAIISTYIQTTNIGQKMRLTRELSESAREITEKIADDVRKNGIDITDSHYDDHGTTSPDFWKTSTYLGSGSEIMAVGTEGIPKKYYIYGSMSGAVISGLSHCNDVKQADSHTNCGLYEITSLSDFSTAYNLADSFIPEDNKKRVKVEDLKFYISGDGVTTEKKVTLVFTLGLMPRSGVSAALAATTKLHIQTTISESFFKQ